MWNRRRWGGHRLAAVILYPGGHRRIGVIRYLSRHRPTGLIQYPGRHRFFSRFQLRHFFHPSGRFHLNRRFLLLPKRSRLGQRHCRQDARPWNREQKPQHHNPPDIILPSAPQTASQKPGKRQQNQRKDHTGQRQAQKDAHPMIQGSPPPFSQNSFSSS